LALGFPTRGAQFPHVSAHQLGAAILRVQGGFTLMW
jgi:hypothetical protein